jgi:hypothetical protein
MFDFEPIPVIPISTPPGLLAHLQLGPNDGISRGDRAETGDEEAQPDEMGTDDAHVTGDPTSFGATTSIRHPSGSDVDLYEDGLGADEMEILPEDNRSLGLTNTDTVPADDWAADTGPTRTPDGKRQL